jgi:hypothetical protein
MYLYRNHCVLELLGHELRTNTNVQRIVLLLLVYSSFPSIVGSFHHIKSPKCKILF